MSSSRLFIYVTEKLRITVIISYTKRNSRVSNLDACQTKWKRSFIAENYLNFHEIVMGKKFTFLATNRVSITGNEIQSQPRATENGECVLPCTNQKKK